MIGARRYVQYCYFKDLRPSRYGLTNWLFLLRYFVTELGSMGGSKERNFADPGSSQQNA